MVVKPSPVSSKHHPPSSPLQLSSLAGYQKFGDYLRNKRKQFGLTQKEMGELLPTLTGQTYGYLERERRAPQIDELVPIFEVLVGLHSDKRLPPMQVIEAETFFRLGKALIEKKQRKRPTVSKEQWDEIEQALMKLAGGHQRPILHLVPDGAPNRLVLESPDSRRRKAIGDALKEDTSHLLEREQWVDKVAIYPDRAPQIKVGVIQAGMGAGKSHALALLIQRLAEREDLFLIPYRFLHSETMTVDDHLDKFLATLYSDLTMRAIDEAKQRSLTERMSQVLNAIRALDQKVVVLLDDAQEMFPSAGEWSPSWHQFFETFMSEPHPTTMYVFTRTWPRWDERKRSFLVEDDLPELSVAAGILLWKRQGFDDVADDLLRTVCQRCGQNPQTIEMLAFQARRRGFSMTWGNRSSSNSTDNPHTVSIKKLLAGETLFSGNLDEKSRRALLHVFSNRLSGETMRLVEFLALAPLGVPFEILFDQFDHGDESFEDLVKASFADLSMAATGRAAVVPLVREAVLQSLTAQRKAEGEQEVTQWYAYWLTTLQDFRDDAEKAALIAEMVVRYIRARQLLEAADLFISFGWLCATFGQVSRIHRVFEEMIYQDRGKDEDEVNEAGRLLLQYHVGLKVGHKIDPRARDTDFRQIHHLVLDGKIVLNPHAQIYLVHTLMQRTIHEKRYQEAYDCLQNTFDRISQANRMTPDVLASFLYNKAYLLGKWSRSTSDTHQATRLTEECVTVLSTVVETLRSCLKRALPVQERYYEFKLARGLNDLAYYARLLHRYDEAEKAITECLYLKGEKKADSLGSLAISLSEYAQILVTKGEYRNADEKNQQALHLLNQLRQDDSSILGNKGMLLVERAHIYEMQGRLEEEKQVLHEALALLNDERDHFRTEAKQRLARIQVIEESSLRYQLDSHWYQRYLPIAQFDDLTWLAQAGPLSDEEQRDWDHWYPRRKEAAAQRQLAEIIGRSRQREFQQSAALGRLPHIHYPAIDIDDVHGRIQDFGALKDEIAQKETNLVIRRLYLDKIEEQVLGLRLIEATHNHDMQTLHRCNEMLYGKISRDEMVIALRECFKMLMRARSHPQAREVAESILKQLKQWHLSAEDFLSVEERSEKRVASQKLQQWRDTPVSSQAVQRLYQEAFQTYGFTEWRVVPSPDRDTISLDLDLCEMYLPTQNRFTALTTAELLAEEIETHILRSVAGKRSKVALLGSGTRGFLPTEEGLAILAVQEMMAAHELEKKHAWITTLAPGIASGVLTPAQSFRGLHQFFNNVFLANHLQSGRYKTVHDAQEKAWQDSLSRVSRTFCGIPDLDVSGVCNLKDRVYLQGYREVSEKIATTPIERLFVGSISIDDVGTMEDLHMVQPTIQHLHLTKDPHLFEHILTLEKQ